MGAVVGAAIVRDGRVLAARRTRPPQAAGRWEFPGGKVEPGESAEEALVREIHEELGCEVAVDGWLPGSVPVGERHVLTVAFVSLVAGEPVPSEHDAVRWLRPAELEAVDWLDPDRPFLAPLRVALAGRREDVPVRGIFFDEDQARAAVSRLRADGYDASLARERLAGEDDDEGHPWAVLTDAPAVVLELLVDEYDGWLDTEPAAPVGRPMALPSAPKRVKRS
jgi:8-oxo-dGTP diphosphatase